ncbi:MAG: hypothetical protein JWQ66_1680 [Mucilaginibacter sp.]|nr:hypothetical protein [Mucilaginibacter sp.]
MLFSPFISATLPGSFFQRKKGKKESNGRCEGKGTGEL